MHLLRLKLAPVRLRKMSLPKIPNDAIEWKFWICRGVPSVLVQNFL
jgi:hypothetical protein